jgi:hypothetical protein
MAYNPFHAFRKHQKVFFAGLTILCMVTFVLAGSSGYFQELALMFGAPRRGVTNVATLYGKPIGDADIAQFRHQREMANQFMVLALDRANQNASDTLAQALPKSEIDAPIKKYLEQIVRGRNAFHGRRQPNDTNNIQELFQAYQTYQEMLRNPDMLGFFRHSLTESGKKTEADLVETLQFVLSQDNWLAQKARTELYFGGSTDAEGILDFMIWRHQADRLGIRLTKNEVGSLILRDTNKLFTVKDEKEIYEGLSRRFGGMSRQLLNDSLAEEFRVRLAQEALIGEASRTVSGQLGVGVTPYELWKFYREQRTEGEVMVLPIPVEHPDFIKKAGEPTEDELQKFYKEGKDREYAPESDLAGFKQAARIEVEWVRARADSPAFRRAGEVVTAATQATMPLALNAGLGYEYSYMKYQYPVASWTREQMTLHDSSINRPETLVATLGQALASGSTGGSALSVLGLSGRTAIQSEAADRAIVGSRLLLAGSAGNPLPVAALAAYYTPPSEYLPLEAVRDKVAEKVRDEITRHLVSESLRHLEDDLREHAMDRAQQIHDQRSVNHPTTVVAVVGQALGVAGTGGNPLTVRGAAQQAAAVRDFRDNGPSYAAMALGGLASPLLPGALAYRELTLPQIEQRQRIAQAIERYGLEHGTTVKFRDRYTLGDDPGLAPLKKAYFPFGGESAAEKRDLQFSKEIYDNAERGSAYTPERLVGNEFLYWKTGEQPAYVPLFAEVRQKVKNRWQFEKARRFAREEAEQLAVQGRKAHGDPIKNLLDGSPHSGKVIFLDKVAGLVSARSAMARPSGEETNYQPYTVPTDKIPYPSDEMAKKLLSLKEKEDVEVMHDKPEAVYYVAALRGERFAPMEYKFFDDALKPASLLSRLEQDEHVQENYRKGCIDELRAEAKRTILDPEFFTRTTGRTTSSDED